MLGGRVNLKFSLYISFRHVGQDAASKAAAVMNTGRWAQLYERISYGQILEYNIE